MRKVDLEAMLALVNHGERVVGGPVTVPFVIGEQEIDPGPSVVFLHSPRLKADVDAVVAQLDTTEPRPVELEVEFIERHFGEDGKDELRPSADSPKDPRHQAVTTRDAP